MSMAYCTTLGRVITVAEADVTMNGSLLCRTETCRVPVSFVPAHVRQYSERTVPIRPFFRLSGRDAAHTETCPYNTRGQVLVIVRGSDPDVIGSLDAGERKFRLNILMANPARLADEAVRASKKVGGRDTTTPPQRCYVSQGRLTSYLRTVNQIMKLRARIEGNDELAKYIELDFQGLKVRWADFFYEDAPQFGKCFDYLGRLWSRPERVHPVCIQGRVKQVYPPKGKFYNYAIRLHSPRVEVGEDGIKHVPSVRIVLGERVQDIAAHIPPEGTVAAHAVWRVSRSGMKELNKQNVIFHDIECTVFNAQQLYVEQER